MGVELSVPFLGSLIVIWLLRRLDKSNINLKKFKGILERGEKQLNDIVLQKTEELKDGTTELDILQINTKKQLTNFKDEIGKSENILAEIEVRRANLGTMGKYLGELENTTESVKGQLSYISDFLEKIDHHYKKVKKLEERLAKADSETSKILKLFQYSIDEKSKEHLKSVESKVQDILHKADYYEKEVKDEIDSRQNKLTEDIRQEYILLENSLRKSGQELSSDIESKFNHNLSLCTTIEDKIGEIENQITASIPGMLQELKDNMDFHSMDSQAKVDKLLKIIQVTEENFQKRTQTFRDNIEEQKKEVSQAFLGEIDNLRDQIRQLDFETISKKDEIVQITRKEASKIAGQIEEFKGFYFKAKDEYANKINHEKSKLEDSLAKIYVDYEGKYQDMVEESIQLEKNGAHEIETFIKLGKEEVSQINRLSGEFKILHSSLKNDYFEQAQSAQDKLKEEMSNINEFVNDLHKTCESSKKSYLSLTKEAENGFDNNYQAMSDNFEKLQIDLKEKVRILHAQLKEDYLEQAQSAQDKLKEEMFNINEFVNDLHKTYESSKKSYLSLTKEAENSFDDNHRATSDNFEKLQIDLEEKMKILHTQLKEDYLEQAESAQDKLKEEMSNADEFVNDLQKTYESSKKNYLSLTKEAENGFDDNHQTMSDDFKKLQFDLEEKMKILHTHLKEDYLQNIELAQNELRKGVSYIGQCVDDFKKKHESSTKDYGSLIEGAEAKIKNETHLLSNQIERLQFDLEEKLKRLHIDLEKDYLEKTRFAQKRLDTMLEKLLNDYKEQLFRDIEHVEEKNADTFEKFEAISEKTKHIFVKLEQQLLDAYRANHESHLDELKKEFGSYQLDFVNNFEKWESKLESLSLEAKDTVHRGEIHLEKKRTEMIEGSREILSKFVEKETEKLNENILTNLKKIQMEAKDIANLKIDLQSKQADLIEHLKDQKKKLESELKTTTYEQLEFFEKEGKKKIGNLNNEINEAASQNLDKVMEALKSADSDICVLKESHVRDIQKEQSKMQNIAINVDGLDSQITSLQEALEEFKLESDVVGVIQNKTNELKVMIDNLGIESEKIEEKQEKVTQLFIQVDEFKKVQAQLDTEISMLSNKKERLSKIEVKLDSLIHVKNEIDERNRDLIDTKKLLDEVLDKQRQIETEKEKTDITIEDLLNQQNLIASAIDSINTQDHNISELTQHISKIDLLLKKLDTKAENLRAHMEGLNTQMLGIQKNDADIELVKEKFLQIEDLLEDIENRKNQIEVMRKRYEDLKDSVNSSVEQIVRVENNAEEKVKKLAEFVNAVGTDISSSSSIDFSKIKASKKDVIIRLAQMGWGRDEIAEKIDVDMSTVETILSMNPH